MFNFSDKKSFEKFIQLTENSAALNACFSNENIDIDDEGNRWISILNALIMSCFKKIRVRRKKFQDSHLPNLFKQKDELFALLKEAEDGNDEDESDRINRSLEIILDEISSKCAEENKKAINKVISLLVDTSDGINPSKIWDVKKKLIQKITPENPSAMKDKRGNIVTDKNHIKKLLRDSYKERLEPNKIEDSLEELEQLKEFLYSERLSKTRLKLTRDWNLEDLNQVLRNLPKPKLMQIDMMVF